MNENLDWNSAIKAIIEQPGVTMVMGDVDTGKTTFAKELVNAGVQAGIPTAFVDADLGQSEVGPPAAISVSLVENPIGSLKELRARRIYFVGYTSPENHLLPTVIGVKQMVDAALAHGAKLVVVDTSGLVKGPLGRKLKLYKTDLLRPANIVGFENKHELDHILAVMSKIKSYNVHRVQVPPEVRTKTKEYRAARRRTQFYEYFKNSDRHFLRLDDIVCWGTFFTTGRAVPWQHYRILERNLKTKVLHAEVVGAGMYIVADCKPEMQGIDALMKHYGTRMFTIVCGTDFTNMLIGLADANANTVDLGIIEAIDFRQRHMAVLTPAKTITPIGVVQFGSMRIKQDGTELGKIKTGEI